MRDDLGREGRTRPAVLSAQHPANENSRSVSRDEGWFVDERLGEVRSLSVTELRGVPCQQPAVVLEVGEIVCRAEKHVDGVFFHGHQHEAHPDGAGVTQGVGSRILAKI